MNTALVILAVLLTVALAIGLWLDASKSRSRQRSAEQLRHELLAADRRLETELHQARRAMNDAAGQSWRNLTG